MKMIVLLVCGIFGIAYGAEMAPLSTAENCTIDARCPSIDNSLFPIFLSHANCNKFYQCSYGKACELTCPVGLHWAVQFNRCDWPNVACCDPSATCLPPTSATTVVTPGNTVPNPMQCTVDARCPLDDNYNNPTLLSHESNCGLFYKCSHGKRCPLQCKAGEHFSAQLQRCDWAQVACCDPTIPCQQHPTTAIVPTTPVVPTDLPSTDCRPDSRCLLSDDTSKPTLLSVTGNCEAFYKCRNGDACLLPCPTGQHFSQTLQRCEWPAVACCDPSKCVQSQLLELLNLQK